MKIHTENIPGNIHAAAHWINKRGLAEYLVCMSVSGNYTIAVFKMPNDIVHWLRKHNPSWSPNTAIDFDDPKLTIDSEGK